VPQRLLQRHRRHLVEKPQPFRALPLRQQRRGLRIVHPTVLAEPRLRAGLQRPVVHHPHTPERPRQLHFLRRSRMEAVPERPPHHRHRRHALHISNPASEPCRCGRQHRFPPRRERRGIHRQEPR
jgi:hypothetical protein